MSEKKHPYQDILQLPHHTSKTHPPMGMRERAAQFAPFAALTGHKEAVHESARLTDQKKLLDETQKVLLNATLCEILCHIKNEPKIRVTYFELDTKKAGGAYLTIQKNIKKIDEYEKLLVFTDKSKLAIEDIYDLEMLEE